jgi:hypothetical protein
MRSSNSKNSFSDISLENITESDLIFMKSYPHRFKKEWKETHSIDL